ncbi:MAG: endonuclease [Chitinophagaceae bacterium]|nr:endonuclease [Chitinophagaceae bacterium]
MKNIVLSANSKARFTSSLVALLMVCFSPMLQAQFTPGRIVVVKTTGSVSKGGSAVTLNEYTKTGVAGTSLALPVTGANPIQMAAGSGGSEGFLTRTPDGTALILAGYSTSATGITDITGTASATTPRIIYKVDAFGNYNQVGSSTTNYNNNDIRGAVSDGSNYWASGASNATDGINYYGPGTPTALATGVKAYGLQLFNGQIYFSTQKTGGVTPSFGIYALGTGTPTSGTITADLMISTGTATPEDFSINPTADVCYIAINMNTSAGGIQKWTKSGGIWTLAYTFATGTNGAYGLVVDYSSNNPVIYATTNEANTVGNRIVTITDSNATATVTQLVGSTANTFYHGIAFSPTCPLPAQPAAFTTSSSIVNPGQSGIVYTIPNDPTVSYNWSYSGNGSTINGTSNNITVDFSNAATAGNLLVTAQNGCGISAATSNAITVAGAMRITEFMYNSSGTGGEYVEFTNIGGTAVDLSGWSFDDNSRLAGSQSLSAFGTVQPGESVILTELSVATFRTLWNLCATVKVIGGSTNGLGREDEINLYDASNALIDRLTFGDQTYSAGSIRTSGKSGWVSAAGLGKNDITKWTLSGNGDAEVSYSSTTPDIGSPGKSTLATVIFDPCLVVNGAPTIVFHTTTTNYLDGGISIAPTSPFALSGVISDPTDPATTSGIDFTIGDAETAVGSLTVTATSNNTTVVPAANLSLTGSNDTRNLKITPAAVGYAGITVTVSDGTNTTSFVLSYAASAASSTPAATVWHTGMSDASEAISLDDDFFLANDDELNVLNVYSRSSSGLPLKSFDYTSYLNLPNQAKPEVDLEAAAVSKMNPGKIYWLGSMSNTKAPFNSAPNRDRIFATEVSGTGTSTTFSFAGYYALRSKILTWGDANGYDFTTSAAAGKDSKATDGFAAEGMVFGPDNTTLYIGLRAPLVPTATRTQAVIVPVIDFENWFNNGTPAGNAAFGAPIELNLGGRGIRGMIRMTNGTYLIVAGNAAGDPLTSAIFKWAGKATDVPVLVTTSANNVLNMEGVMQVNESGQLSLSKLQVISDGGDDVLYNDGESAKDFADLGLRKFRSDALSSIDLCLNTTSLTTISSCSTYVWNTVTYNETGIYTVHLTNAGGCDSTATLDLTITDAPAINAGQDQIICTSADAVVLEGTSTHTTSQVWTSSGLGSFTPDNTSLTASYIPTETDLINGSVTLTLTSDNTGICSTPVSDDMITTFSICTAVVGSADASDIQLLPNPNDGDLAVTISGTFVPTELTIYNTNSEKVRELTIASHSNTLHLDLHELKTGIYIILLKDAEGKQMVKRMIKK